MTSIDQTGNLVEDKGFRQNWKPPDEENNFQSNMKLRSQNLKQRFCVITSGGEAISNLDYFVTVRKS